MTTEYLNLYLDHPKTGYGWRNYLVLKRGRIHARLLCTENAEALTVPVADLAHGRAVPLKPRKLAKRIRATAQTYARIDSAGVKLACSILRQT